MITYSSNNPPKGFYVYAYVRTASSTNGKIGTPYYIGKGKGHRAFFRSKREATKPLKDLSNVIILESNLTEIGALALERRIIRWWGRQDLGTGILHNRTDGGDGISNPSKETREKIGRANTGRKWTEKQRQMLSEMRKGKKKPNQSKRMLGKNNPMFGKKREKTKGSTGMKWYNNGKDTIFYNDCPPGFVLGNLNRKRLVGSKQPTAICPHCNLMGGAYNLKRYHFDNCKRITQ